LLWALLKEAIAKSGNEVKVEIWKIFSVSVKKIFQILPWWSEATTLDKCPSTFRLGGLAHAECRVWDSVPGLKFLVKLFFKKLMGFGATPH